jgi:deoxyribonuclease-4
MTKAIGGRGVVVHTGTYTHCPDADVAANKMEYALRHAIQFATEECPILLETPAGEGKDIVWNIRELATFWLRFNENERKRLRICVDTCHVFAANHDPQEYLQMWTDAYGAASIGLVHFNDSRGCRGCRRDQHSYYMRDEGHIGLEKMLKVAELCANLNIPMVHE